MIGELALFVLGIKKAYLTDKGAKGEAELVSNFPYIFFVQNQSMLYFQSEKDKVAFLKKGISPEGSRLPYNERELGLLLGFPKVAVEDYCSGITEEEKTLIIYHGLHFVVKRQNVKQALQELNTTMPVPAEINKNSKSHIEIRKFQNGFVKMEEQEIKKLLA